MADLSFAIADESAAIHGQRHGRGDIRAALKPGGAGIVCLAG